MFFSLGNILTILIVIAVLAVYRQLDVNNRSLDKMKKYFGKIKEELDSIVEEKAMGLKDLAIELEVHEKTVKEVYNRIDQRNNDLLARADEIENIHKKIDNYDAVLQELAEMTNRVDENLKRLHEESVFVDGVGRKIKDTSDSIDKLEKRVPHITEDFSRKNNENMELLKIGLFNEIELKTNTVKQILEDSRISVESFKAYIEELEERRDVLGEETIKTLKNELQDISESFRTETDRTEDEFKQRIFAYGEKGLALGEEVFDKIKNQVESRAEDITADIDGNLSLLESRIKEQFEKIGNEMTLFEKEITGRSGKIEEAQDMIVLLGKKAESYKQYITGLEQKRDKIGSDFFESINKELEEKSSGFQNIIKNISSDLAGTIKKAGDETRDLKMKMFESLKAEIINNAEKVKEELNIYIEGIDRKIIDNLSAVEAGVSEYESALTYRIESFEGITGDIEIMEKNLKAMISKVSEKMRDDFKSFEISLEAEKTAQKVKLENDFAEIRDAIDTLESKLAELKKKSYDNVNEKLQVFEDEFFKDIKNRNEAIQTELDSWQKGIETRISTITEESLGVREEIEAEYTEKLREKFNEIQLKNNSQYQKYENQISIFKNEIDERLHLVAGTVKNFEDTSKSEIEDIKISSYNHFNKEFADYHTGLDEKLRQYEKEMDSRLKSIVDNVDVNKKELFSSIDNVKADILGWYSAIEHDLKENKNAAAEQFVKNREEIFKLLDNLKKEYADEKNELIEESRETRELYRNKLAEISAGIIKLYDELNEKSRTAVEKLKNDSDIFMIDFQKKTRELEQEIDNKIKEFKTGVADLKEKIDNSEKKMLGKISESSRNLNITLDDIDKKQKNFAAQTKIFERADTLKITLQEKIEDLKGEIIKIDAQSRDIKAAERKFDNIRKLGEEVSTKLNRFLSEKRKIDEIEGDFKKLLNMSQAVDIKLDHITGVYDNLQEIEAKLRNFDTLFKDISEKFQRLEKKDNIIESTIEGVDRNFQIMQQMEKGLSEITDITDMLPMRLNELEDRFKKISIEKGEAEKVIGNLGKLDKVLSDVEDRIDKMQQAREWLARTETRLSDAGKKAEDNIALLGTLLEKDSKGKKSQKDGAPPLDKREMVVKLAHQGWTSENIAQATGLSRGEVELILEIMPKPKR